MSAKNLLIYPIKAKDAHRFIEQEHYSGRRVQNAQLHFGVFWRKNLEGVMQFGPSMDKRKTLGLVPGTSWNGFLELNRLAFTERLPRNSESRALGVALRMIRKNYPHIEWIISFADATQCGDGTIYRAAGFDLIGIKKNTTIWSMPDGGVINRMPATDARRPQRQELLNRVTLTKGKRTFTDIGTGTSGPAAGSASMAPFKEAGAAPLKGFQLRYVKFLNPAARERLAVPVLPFSKIDEMGAGMYLGRPKQGTGGDQPLSGGAAPTRPLQASVALKSP